VRPTGTRATPLHEMLIVLTAATYVRPHRHHKKSESFMSVEGALSVVVLDDGWAGARAHPAGRVRLGEAILLPLAEAGLPHDHGRDALGRHSETDHGPFDRADRSTRSGRPSEEEEEAGRRLPADTGRRTRSVSDRPEANMTPFGRSLLAS